jgi:hypothetical protein
MGAAEGMTNESGGEDDKSETENSAVDVPQ